MTRSSLRISIPSFRAHSRESVLFPAPDSPANTTPRPALEIPQPCRITPSRRARWVIISSSSAGPTKGSWSAAWKERRALPPSSGINKVRRRSG